MKRVNSLRFYTYLLHKDEPYSTTELAEIFKRSTNCIYYVMTRLHEHGMVYKKRHRNVCYYVTRPVYQTPGFLKRDYGIDFVPKFHELMACVQGRVVTIGETYILTLPEGVDVDAYVLEATELLNIKREQEQMIRDWNAKMAEKYRLQRLAESNKITNRLRRIFGGSFKRVRTYVGWKILPYDYDDL